jgi:hypothetical protein
VKREKAIRFGQILGCVDIKERVDRHHRPFCRRTAASPGEEIDLANALFRNGVPQLVAYRDRP